MKRTAICACLALMLVGGMNPTIKIYASSTKETKVETEILGYVGKVTGRVNVRVAAGEKNDKVMHNGEAVRLEEGEEVLIIGEKKVGKKPWYQIRVTLDGEEITGYATSTYIKKTDATITPSPIPTPEPTATPTPTPEPTATPSPEPTASVESRADSTGGGTGNNTVKLIGFSVVTLFVISGIIYAVVKRSKIDADISTTEMAKKVEQLKKLKLDQNAEPDKPVAVMKRRPEIKPSNIKTSNIKEEPYKKESSKEVHKKNSAKAREEYAATIEYATEEAAKTEKSEVKLPNNVSPEEVKENVLKDNEEKRLLRAQIEALREHDIVIHKYFGRGEVFDNSDVKLIEVRFGGDVRFLNKESLVAKKLLTITSEKRR